jgi:hypothetical protein
MVASGESSTENVGFVKLVLYACNANCHARPPVYALRFVRYVLSEMVLYGSSGVANNPAIGTSTLPAACSDLMRSYAALKSPA